MAAAIAKGGPLPDITLEGAAGAVSLESLRSGRPLVVAFYSEDATPTCTAQLNAFREDHDLIEELGAMFVGISADSVQSHRRFGEAGGYPFPLLSDPELAAAKAFGVVDASGKRSLRAIFVTDEAGRIVEAIEGYNPANSQQYQRVFVALGIDAG